MYETYEDSEDIDNSARFLRHSRDFLKNVNRQKFMV